ncbi:MAG: carbohydrate-binding domain-containing protein, partial [Eubacteriales bacterium]|nr:carbohydrate-binding domain-containing protein [Eubacteriales bacterium]
MKRERKHICRSVCLALLLLLSGCGNGGTKNDTTIEDAEQNAVSSESAQSTGAAAKTADMFTDRDRDARYDAAAAAYITLNGNTAECGSNAVQIDGATVTIKDEGTYVLSGALTDGMIIVDADDTDKLRLILNEVSVHSSSSAALYVRQADKVVVTTAAGSENALDENNIDAAIFSKDDLTFNGDGSLTVGSPAGHGVVSKDDLVFTGGTYTVSAASQALSGKDSIRIADGTFMLTAGKDGIHAEHTDDASLGFVYIADGSYTIAAEGDGISASASLQIDGGSFDITAGGGSENGIKASSDHYGRLMGGRGGPMQRPAETTEETASMKGLKAGGSLTISGGDFIIDSADDSVHSNASIAVDGGTFELSTGDDGFHADETLTVTEGVIVITESYEGMEGLTVDISGGEISIVATDDGINAAGGADASGMGGRDMQFGGGRGSFSSGGSIVISGGTIDIRASGDAVDSNGTLSITGGSITTSGPNAGDTSILDFDTSGTISGGTFIGTGASSMAQNFSSDSPQGVIMASVGNRSAGTTVTLKDPNGKILLTRQTDQDFSCVILSCADIVQGGTYTLVVGPSETSITMDGTVYTDGGMDGF